MRNEAIWAAGLVSVCTLVLVAASPAPRASITGAEPVVCAPLDGFIARNLREAMEFENQAVAALGAARARQTAASAALLERRGDGTGGDPSHVHALNRLAQAIQSTRLAENSLTRSLDDLAGALEALPATSPLATIVLSPAPLSLNACSDVFELTATALDGTGTPVEGETISFQFVDPGPLAVGGMFTPSSAITDASGHAMTMLTFSQSVCFVNCTGGTGCSAQIRAVDQGGLVISNTVQIIDQIP